MKQVFDINEHDTQLLAKEFCHLLITCYGWKLRKKMHCVCMDFATLVKWGVYTKAEIEQELQNSILEFQVTNMDWQIVMGQFPGQGRNPGKVLLVKRLIKARQMLISTDAMWANWRIANLGSQHAAHVSSEQDNVMEDDKVLYP